MGIMEWQECPILGDCKELVDHVLFEYPTYYSERNISLNVRSKFSCQMHMKPFFISVFW